MLQEDSQQQTASGAGLAPERVVRRIIRGHEFGFRRPTRGDEAEINRRFAAKLVVTGLQIETDMLNAIDGDSLLWEARLQVCLKTRQLGQKVLDFGETAPAHWLNDGVISFDRVDADEFTEVVREFRPIFAPKAPVAPALTPEGGE